MVSTGMSQATTRVFKFYSKANGKPDLPALNIIRAKFRIVFVHIEKLEKLK